MTGQSGKEPAPTPTPTTGSIVLCFAGSLPAAVITPFVIYIGATDGLTLGWVLGAIIAFTFSSFAVLLGVVGILRARDRAVQSETVEAIGRLAAQLEEIQHHIVDRTPAEIQEIHDVIRKALDESYVDIANMVVSDERGHRGLRVVPGQERHKD
jgi:hypothetical protein